MTTVGSGDYRYELVPSWPDVPKYWVLGICSDVAVNSSDEIHVFSRGAHPLTIWTPSGDFVSSWGEGAFSNNEHGIYITPDDNVWLVDSNFHIATEHKPDGTLLRTLGTKLTPQPTYYGNPFNMPSGLALGSDGSIFVSDGYGNKRVHKFGAEGELVKSWGTFGTGPGEFALVHNLAVDSQGRVLVCDRENNRIQIFDGEGDYLGEWTDLHMPGDIYVKDGVVYVVEQGEEGGVSIWTESGELITRWHGDRGPGKGSLVSGHGICVDAEGSIYVAELSPGDRVQKFQRV